MAFSNNDKNLDVLQNLEFAVVEVWREHREMTDYAAIRAYEAAHAYYRDLARGHVPKPVQLTGLDGKAFAAVQLMCEFRLGAAKPDDAPADLEPIPVADLVGCLSKLRKSAELWHKQGGRQGYLQFVSQYVR